jgi:hypothetical protein
MMPKSSELGKVFSKKMIDSIKPSTILDVGIGAGTYRDLCASNTAIWDGVEIFQPYIERFNLNQKYSTIFNEDVRTFTPTKNYDLVIFGDILEHITENEALEVLAKTYDYTKYVLISLPLDGDTGAPAGTGDVDWGNVHELHVAKWKYDDFKSYIENNDKIKLIAEERYYEIVVFFIDVV